MAPDKTGFSPRRDPRSYQIVSLSALLLVGLALFDFDIQPVIAATMVATALICQYLCTRLWQLPNYDPRSALISSLSLCLLLRTDALSLAILAAVITILSKFLLRANDKHIFNPTNFGLVCMLALTDQVWISPGQWGETAWLAFLFACVGGLVLFRSERSDVSIAFLAFYSGLLFMRAAWLGDPLVIPLHYLTNGALLIFAFFMISDPKTIPDARIGRIAFAAVVASLAVYIQFYLYQPSGLLWALVLTAPLTPLLDRIFIANRYQWTPQRSTE